MDSKVQVFYDSQGKPMAVQMPIEDYEKLIKSIEESAKAKEAIKNAIKALQEI